MPTRNQAKVVAPHEPHTLRQTPPKSWVNAAGLLRGKKVDPVAYQRRLRQERRKRREQLFDMIEEVWERNKRVPPKVMEREVAAAVKAVRAKPTRRKE